MSGGLVYGLLDPRRGCDGVRYVGMTRNVNPYPRLKAHCAEARNPKRRTTHRTRWVGKLLDEGVTPVVVKLAFVADDEALGKVETDWIARLRAEGYALVNTAPGGEGRRGPMSAESRARMSAARKGVPKSAAHAAALGAASRGRKHPPRTAEWRAARSALMTGRHHSEETKAKISAAQKGKSRPGTSAFATQRPRAADGTFL